MKRTASVPPGPPPPRARAARLSVLVVLLAIGAPSSLALGAPQRARLVVDACADGPFGPADLSRLLALELGDLALTRTTTGADVFVAVAVPDCGPHARTVEIAALLVASGAGTTQALRVDAGRPGVARVVAVAAAERVRELLRASANAQTPPPAEPAPPPWSPTPEWEAALLARARAPAPPRSPPRRLTLTAGVDAYPSMAAALPGAALDLAVLTSSATALRLDVGALVRGTSERDVRGTVDLLALAGTVAARTWIDAGPLELAAGARLALGWAGASGSTDNPTLAGRRIDALLAEAWLDLLLSWHLDDRWTVGARLSAGHVLSGLAAQADGLDVTGVDGAALGAALSIGAAL